MRSHCCCAQWLTDTRVAALLARRKRTPVFNSETDVPADVATRVSFSDAELLPPPDYRSVAQRALDYARARPPAADAPEPAT